MSGLVTVSSFDFHMYPYNTNYIFQQFYIYIYIRVNLDIFIELF